MRREASWKQEVNRVDLGGTEACINLLSRGCDVVNINEEGRSGSAGQVTKVSEK